MYRNNEAALKAGLGLAVLEGLGFESATSSSLVQQMRRVRCQGMTSLRDSVIQGTKMMLELYQVLSECNIAKAWNFVHIVLTDGEDNSSNASRDDACFLMALIGQTIPVEMLKTWFIGVNIKDNLQAATEIASLVISGGENTEFADITDANLEDIFAQLSIKLGLVRRPEVSGVRLGNQAFLTVQEKEYALFSVEEKHYVVLFNIDISGSMEPRWSRVCESVNKFVKHLGPRDLVAGLVFNEQVKLLTQPGSRPAPQQQQQQRQQPRVATPTIPKVTAPQFRLGTILNPKYFQASQDLRMAMKKVSLRYNTRRNREATAMTLVGRASNDYRAFKNAELRNQGQGINDESASRDPVEYLRSRRVSDDFKVKVKKWTEKGKTVLLTDNFVAKTTEIIKTVVNREKVAVNIIADQAYFCDICQKKFISKEAHDCQFTDPYTSLLRTYKGPRLSELLVSLVEREHWDWEPVKIPKKPEYLAKFEEISKLIENNMPAFKRILPIIETGGDSQWLVYFEATKSRGLMQTIKGVSDVRPILSTTALEQRNMKQTISMTASQTQKKPSSLFKKDTALRITYGDLQVITPGNGFIDDARIPVMKIETPPQWIPDSQMNTCMLCKELISFPHRKHHCRACGGIFCSKCLVEGKILKFGYPFPTKVCRVCHSKLPQDEAFLWIEHSKNLVMGGYDEDAEKCLYISTCYSVDVTNKMAEMGEQYCREGKYDLALKCYYLANVDVKKWLKLAEEFCEKREFTHAFNCVRNAKMLRKISNNQMIAYGDEYINSSVRYRAGVTNQDLSFYQILSLFCYLEGEKKIQDLILKSAGNEKTGDHDLNAFYLAYASTKNLRQDEWALMGKNMLDNQCFKGALYCYNQAKYPLEKWVEIIEEYCNRIPPNYELAAMLIDALTQQYQPKWLDMKLNGDFTQYFVWARTGNPEMCLDSMLSRYLNLVQLRHPNAKMVLCMLFAVMFGKCKSFSDEANRYLGKRESAKAYLCFSLSKLLENRQATWAEYAETIHDIDIASSLMCFGMDNPSWRKLGDAMFERGRLTTALNCYLESKDGDIYDHILQCARNLTKKDLKAASIYYYAQLFKNRKFMIEIVEDFLEMHPEGPMKDILIATIQESNDYSGKALAMMHVRLAGILEKEAEKNSVETAIGALHYSARYHNGSAKEISRLQQLIMKEEKAEDGFYQGIKTAMEESKTRELAHLIANLDESKAEAVKVLCRELVEGRDISQLPVNSKCYVYLLRAATKIHEKQMTEALVDLKTALICYPVNGIPDAVAILLRNENLQAQAYQNMVADLTNIYTSEFKQLGSFCSTTVPEDYNYQELLKGGPLLNKIRQFEKAVNSRYDGNHLESAMYYLDLCGEMEDASALSGSLIMSGLYLLNAQKQTRNDGEVYAYRNAIVEIMLNAYNISVENLSPSMQIYVNKIALIAIINANQNLSKYVQSKYGNRNGSENIIDSPNEQIIRGLVTNIMQKAKVTPITKLPTSFSCDTAYLDLACRSYTQSHLTTLSEKPTTLCPGYMAEYYLLEGAWKRWFVPETDFDLLRLNLMRFFIQKKGWTLNNVQRVIDWPAIQRAPGGWLENMKPRFNFYSKSYRKITGIQMNTRQGTISVMLEEANSDEGLFTSLDVHNVLAFGIKGAMLTLDQLDDSMPLHPFQEMKYYPKELAHTDYLATLQQADSLLKMMSVGVEMSATQPFHTRKTSEGFMRRVPQQLQETLKSVPERTEGKATTSEDSHSFWIEAGELSYNCQEKDDVITYVFGDVKMEVKQKLMKYDINGNAVDAREENSDRTPEAEFAKAFTRSYDEFGRHFPVLLRLKELVKLNAMCACIQKTYAEANDAMKNASINTNDITASLSNLKKQVTDYPKNTTNNVDNVYAEVLRQNGIYNLNSVPWNEREQIKGEIRNQLDEVDKKILNEATKNIADAYNMQSYEIKAEVDKWLKGWTNNLVGLIAGSIKKPVQAKYSGIVQEIDRLDINVTSNQSVEVSNNGEHCWVPTMFGYSKNDFKNTKVFGGVSLGLNMVQDSKIAVNVQNQKSINLRDVIQSTKETNARYNFPKENANGTFSGQKDKLSNIYTQYSNVGTLNGNSGTYEIGVKTYSSRGKNVDIITQRFFRPNNY